jgi:signal transduction histidine kinase
MDTPRQEEVWGRVAAALHGAAPRAGLSCRLTALQRGIERAYPLTLALDIVDRRAIDALPAELADAVHALAQEAALNAARYAQAALARVNLQLTGGTVLLSIADDGTGFPFAGVYDLNVLQALDVGPRWLMQRVAALGGTLTLASGVAGTRIDIAIPREMVAPAATVAPRAAA